MTIWSSRFSVLLAVQRNAEQKTLEQLTGINLVRA